MRMNDINPGDVLAYSPERDAKLGDAKLIPVRVLRTNVERPAAQKVSRKVYGDTEDRKPRTDGVEVVRHGVDGDMAGDAFVVITRRLHGTWDDHVELAQARTERRERMREQHEQVAKARAKAIKDARARASRLALLTPRDAAEATPEVFTQAEGASVVMVDGMIAVTVGTQRTVFMVPSNSVKSFLGAKVAPLVAVGGADTCAARIAAALFLDTEATAEAVQAG